jgi:DNA primase
MIPDHKKEEVRQAADIVEVVGEHVKLKRSGSGYIGLCPFHNEKSPSFHVTPRMGIYKCFGCGAGGDVFQFVMQMDGVGFTEAIRTLGAKYNIDLPEETDHSASDPEYQRKEGVYHALRFAGVFFHNQLMESDEAEEARQYLKTRSFKRETIVKGGLGYAPSKGDALCKAAISAGINMDYLMDAGLARVDDAGTRHYDYFRGRLMFPIFNPSAKVIAFAGRILGNEKTAKYINSPQTIVYNKSEVLYGIHMARNEIRKSSTAILVEGYTDVLSLYQAGIANVVASSGTALTADQVRLVHRYGDTLLMIYDSDAAGQAAMIRGMDIAIAEGLEVRMLELPDGEDPDSFVRQFGGEAFTKYSNEEAADFLTFLIRKAQHSGTWDEPGRKQKSVSRMLRSLALMREPVKRETYIQYLSQQARIGDRTLFEELGQLISRHNRDARVQQTREENESSRTRSRDGGNEHRQSAPTVVPPQKRASEKEVLRIMLSYGKPIVEFIGSFSNADHFEDPELRGLYEDIIKTWEEDGDISISAYTEKPPPIPSIVSELVVDRHSVSDNSAKKLGKIPQRDTEQYAAAQGALKALKMQHLERLRSNYETEIEDAVDPEEQKRLQRMITKVANLKVKMQTRPLDELFPGAPHEQNKKNEDYNPFDAADYLSRMKKKK